MLYQTDENDESLQEHDEPLEVDVLDEFLIVLVLDEEVDEHEVSVLVVDILLHEVIDDHEYVDIDEVEVEVEILEVELDKTEVEIDEVGIIETLQLITDEVEVEHSVTGDELVYDEMVVNEWLKYAIKQTEAVDLRVHLVDNAVILATDFVYIDSQATEHLLL